MAQDLERKKERIKKIEDTIAKFQIRIANRNPKKSQKGIKILQKQFQNTLKMLKEDYGDL